MTWWYFVAQQVFLLGQYVAISAWFFLSWIFHTTECHCCYANNCVQHLSSGTEYITKVSFFPVFLQIGMEAAQSGESVSKSCPQEQGAYSTRVDTAEANSILRGFRRSLFNFLLTATHQSHILGCDFPHCCSLIWRWRLPWVKLPNREYALQRW